ncbi:hypothetical protein CEXT_4471 [Caerostris extrusa]|uniref:Uncharacterized protein n=1 Tax=Caerostris extrusa TaxID=172846 RepID=A0AAV4N0A5_CAEEX|nr:hypothetical protein CEXT_4471 [Caerostris extrusa]
MTGSHRYVCSEYTPSFLDNSASDATAFQNAEISHHNFVDLFIIKLFFALLTVKMLSSFNLRNERSSLDIQEVGVSTSHGLSRGQLFTPSPRELASHHRDDHLHSSHSLFSLSSFFKS